MHDTKLSASFYQQEVARTESIPTPKEFKERLEQCWPNLRAILLDSVKSMERLDKYKKYLFYSKDTGVAGQHRMDDIDAEDINSLTNYMRFFHAVIGLGTEFGELLESLPSHARPIVDVVNVKEELGDVAWYLGTAANALEADLGNIFYQNIEKLRVRYPEKFTVESANNRDLAAERVSLESNTQLDPGQITHEKIKVELKRLECLIEDKRNLAQINVYRTELGLPIIAQI